MLLNPSCVAPRRPLQRPLLFHLYARKTHHILESVQALLSFQQGLVYFNSQRTFGYGGWPSQFARYFPKRRVRDNVTGVTKCVTELKGESPCLFEPQ